MKIDSKLPDTGTNIFSVMSKMAADHQAINLSQGFPDFKISQQLQDLVTKYMELGMNQYAAMQGVQLLRENIARKVNKIYRINVDPDLEVTVTAGATEALYATITALVDHGDEVIVFEPSYDSYTPAIKLNGGVPVYIKLQQPGFYTDWDLVKKAINKHTKLIIINTPHNPTGATLSSEDIQQLESIVEGTGILILSDEVYEHIIFDGQKHQSVLSSNSLRQRSVAVFSFGKTFHATGWKIGYCVAPENLNSEIQKIHQFLTFCVNTPVQYAIADYLENEENYLTLSTFYQEKRDLFCSLIKNSRFTLLNARGTYFQLLSYKNITDKTDIDVAGWITKEFGVASIPISVFYHDQTDNQYLRFCFAKSEETIKKAAEKLCGI